MSSSSVRMTRTLTRPASGEISGAFFALRCLVEFDAEKAESVADPLADERRVFADAAGEHQRVQSAQRRREGADPFLGLVAKQRDRFRRPHVLRFTVEQVTHVGTGLRHAEQPGLVVHHFLKLRRGHALGARQVVDQARIEVAGAGAHHQSRRGREAHAGVDALAVTHGGQARAVAEMGEDHATLRCRRVAGVRVPP